MRKEYDFSKAKRNPYAKRLKQQITNRLDKPTIEYFRELAEPGEGGFIGEDSFYGTVIAIRSGNRIAVILGAPSVEFGTVALTELVANM